MSAWSSLFRKPKTAALDDWFLRIADRLLNGSQLVAGQRRHRLVEIEFYYWSEEHPDPFTHRDPIQFHIGRWYFHRTHGAFRGGSFKGLDLTFGDARVSGGILFRGLETPDGAIVDGPSRCVDHLLDATGKATVAELERASNERLAWEEGNPLMLEQTDALEKKPILRSPRVGLRLKKAAARGEATHFLMRPYRYLNQPQRTKKGRLYLVLALHAQGADIDDIQRTANSPRRVVERYVADFEIGRKEADFTPYFGKDLGPVELCKLYGVCFAHWGFFGEMR